jgi:hypothetical protein
VDEEKNERVTEIVVATSFGRDKTKKKYKQSNLTSLLEWTNI